MSSDNFTEPSTPAYDAYERSKLVDQHVNGSGRVTGSDIDHLDYPNKGMIGGDDEMIQKSFNGVEPPEDTGIVKVVFFIWGVGVLPPWNVTMNEFDYLNQQVSVLPLIYYHLLHMLTLVDQIGWK